MNYTQHKTNKIQPKEKDPEKTLKFKQWLNQIYLQQATLAQLSVVNDYSQFILPSQQAFSLVREKMVQTTATSKKLINNSLESIFKNNYPTYKQFEVAIRIISDHFQNIAKANKQACLLWQKIFQNINLQQDFLNRLALFQIVPTNINVSISKMYDLMPKILQRHDGQGIRFLHSYLVEKASQDEDEDDQHIQTLAEKHQRLKKQVQKAKEVRSNLEKAINKSHCCQKILNSKHKQNDFNNEQREDSESNRTSNNDASNLNKKNKKRKNKKKKKKGQNLQAEQQSINNNNEFDDLPDLVSIKNGSKKLKSQDAKVQTHNFASQPSDKNKLLSKKEIQKIKREQIERGMCHSESEEQLLQWSDSELALLNFIESFQLDKNRLECNVSEEYLDFLIFQTETIVNKKISSKN